MVLIICTFMQAGFFDPSSDIGVVPPLGLFDPLNLISRGPDAYRRYQEVTALAEYRCYHASASANLS